MTLRLLHDTWPRVAEQVPARRRVLSARPQVARGLRSTCRRRPLQRKLRPASYQTPPAPAVLSFSAPEALGRLLLLRLASALAAPWLLLLKLARHLRAGGAAGACSIPRAPRRRQTYLSAALRKVRAT